MSSAISPTRKENYPKWYLEVIKQADMAENAPVRGCMVIKPWGYGIWEEIQKVLDGKFKETGHQNAYFPLLIPLSFLEKEAEHIEGFAKECAVVTHHRLEEDKEGGLKPAGKLEEPYVIRPTSETIIGEVYSKWIKSYRDLPILINQWANVMRWEMRTRLFLRTSEFLWQEGHTVHATSEEAMEETKKMLNVYEVFCKEYLAIPVFSLEKTPEEKFPGAVNTYAIEALMQDGKALQAGTSHFMGQTFAKSSNIKFLDKDGSEQYGWTTSWGVSTRLIGGLIMAHSDDNGLVLPPKVSPQHIIVLPIFKNSEDENKVIEYCEDLKKEISSLLFNNEKVRVHIDKRDIKGGDKYWGAIKKGVPICIEVGPREVDNKTLSFTRRDSDKIPNKLGISREKFIHGLNVLLNEIQDNLYSKALKYRESMITEVNDIKSFNKLFSQEDNNSPGYAVCYCSIDKNDIDVRLNKTKPLKVSARCFFENTSNEKGQCIFTGKLVSTKVYFAKAY